MPRPVSDTLIRTAPSRPQELAPSRGPPRSVNFTALFSRFQTTCWTRSGSAGPAPPARPVDTSTATPLASAIGCTASTAAPTPAPVPPPARSAASCPTIMREMSSRSSINCRCASAPVSIASIAWPSPARRTVARPQHLRPQQDRRQRRAQLVRDAPPGTRPASSSPARPPARATFSCSSSRSRCSSSLPPARSCRGRPSRNPSSAPASSRSGVGMPLAKNRSPPLRTCHRSSAARPRPSAVASSFCVLARRPVLGSEQDGRLLADDLGLGVAEDAARPRVPRRHPPGGVHHEDGVIAARSPRSAGAAPRCARSASSIRLRSLRSRLILVNPISFPAASRIAVAISLPQNRSPPLRHPPVLPLGAPGRRGLVDLPLDQPGGDLLRRVERRDVTPDDLLGPPPLDPLGPLGPVGDDALGVDA